MSANVALPAVSTTVTGGLWLTEILRLLALAVMLARISVWAVAAVVFQIIPPIDIPSGAAVGVGSVTVIRALEPLTSVGA
jgi:hypothetical protein